MLERDRDRAPRRLDRELGNRSPGRDLLDEPLEILTENRHRFPESPGENETELRSREVELRPGSAKLRDRARRIVEALASVDSERASKLLEQVGDVKTAVAMGRLGISSTEARRRLARRKGDLRAVLSSADARARSRPRRAPARPRARKRKPSARLS